MRRLKLSLIPAAFALVMALAAPARSIETGPGRSGQLGLGLIAGSPAGLTLKYWMNSENALDIAVGNFGYYVGSYYPGVNLHVDYLWHRFGVFGPSGSNASTHLPLYFGVGGMYSSPNVAGARGVFGITYLFDDPFDVFFELAPTLVVGPAQGFGIDAGLGGRFYF